MKSVYKNGITRSIQDKDLEKYQDAGWSTSQEQAREEVIRLKPPTVKSKATVTAVEEANITNKGDE
jgi:hypothetical protein